MERENTGEFALHAQGNFLAGGQRGCIVLAWLVAGNVWIWRDPLKEGRTWRAVAQDASSSRIDGVGLGSGSGTGMRAGSSPLRKSGLSGACMLPMRPRG